MTAKMMAKKMYELTITFIFNYFIFLLLCTHESEESEKNIINDDVD